MSNRARIWIQSYLPPAPLSLSQCQTGNWWHDQKETPQASTALHFTVCQLEVLGDHWISDIIYYGIYNQIKRKEKKFHEVNSLDDKVNCQ